MRLIPDYLFERLNQLQNIPDLGDPDSIMNLILTGTAANILNDKTRSVEDRVRIFTQHLMRKLNQKEMAVDTAKQEQSLQKSLPHANQQAAVLQPETTAIARTEPPTKRQKRKHKQHHRSSSPPLSPPLHPYSDHYGNENDDDDDDERYGTADEWDKKENDLDISETPIDSSVKPEPKAAATAESAMEKQAVKAVPIETREPSPEPLTSTRRLLQLPPADAQAISSHTPPPARQRTGSQSSVRQKTVQSLGSERIEIRSNLKKLLNEFFTLQPDGKMVFKDDGETVLKGGDHDKILSFLVPSKNIHPSKKPNSFAAVVDILRTRNLFSPDLFPNTSLAAVFKEYGSKPTAFTQRIRAYNDLLDTSKKIELILSQDGSGISWPTFD